MFRASSAHLQEDTVVHMQHMVLSLSIRVRGGLSIRSYSMELTFCIWCMCDRASYMEVTRGTNWMKRLWFIIINNSTCFDYILITNLRHWLLFIHKVLLFQPIAFFLISTNSIPPFLWRHHRYTPHTTLSTSFNQVQDGDLITTRCSALPTLCNHLYPYLRRHHGRFATHTLSYTFSKIKF